MIYGIQHPRNRKRGLTLVELLISLTIFSIFMTGLFSLFFYGANQASDGTGKLLINRDIRKFTNEMTENARFSDYFEIYQSFTDRDQQHDGGSGDFLVLSHRDPANQDNISRVVGYYRYEAQDGTEGPVLMFDRTYNPSSTAHLIEPTTFLPRRNANILWSHPAFAHKHIFARNDRELICVDLSN